MRRYGNIVKKGKFNISLRTNAEYQPLIVSFFFFSLLLSFLFVGWSRNITQRNVVICALNSREGGDGVADSGDYGAFGQE